MPKSKKGKKNGGGNGGSARITNVPLLGVNDRVRTTLRYSLVTAQTSIVTTGAFDYVIRGNSCFDPDFSGTGGQPANYDDYSAVYNNYRVFGSRLRVSVMPTISGTEAVTWCIGPRHVSTSITSSTQIDMISQPYTTAKIFNIYRAGAPDCIFNMRMGSAKFLGLSAQEFAGRDDTAAAVGANVGLPWYWHITATNVDPAVTSEVAVLIEIDYDVEFWNRVDTTLDLKVDRVLSLRRGFLEAQRDKPDLKGRYTGMDAWKKFANQLECGERKEEKKFLSVITTDEPPAMQGSPSVPEGYVLVPADTLSKGVPASVRSGTKGGGR